MNLFVMIFMIVATSFALITLGYVAVEILIEKYKRARTENKNRKSAAAKDVSKFKNHTGTEEANAVIAGTFGAETANREIGAGHRVRGTVNIGVLDDSFSAHDVAALLAILKKKGLITSKVGKTKVITDGILSKLSDGDSKSGYPQAIERIELSGGTVIILKD